MFWSTLNDKNGELNENSFFYENFKLRQIPIPQEHPNNILFGAKFSYFVFWFQTEVQYLFENVL